MLLPMGLNEDELRIYITRHGMCRALDNIGENFSGDISGHWIEACYEDCGVLKLVSEHYGTGCPMMGIDLSIVTKRKAME